MILIPSVATAEMVNASNGKLVTLQIKKGWNLIPIFMSTSYSFAVSEDTKTEDIYFPDTGIYPKTLFHLGNAESIETITKGPYLLDPINKKYIINVDFWRGRGGKDFTDQEKRTYEAFFSKLDNDLKSNLGMSASWIYSTKNLKIVTKERPEWEVFKFSQTFFNGVSFYKGWNFFSITPDMVGKRAGDIEGNCTINKTVVWNADKQSWDTADESSFFGGSNSKTLASSYVGLVLAMKVAENCKLLNSGNAGVESIPPVIPD